MQIFTFVTGVVYIVLEIRQRNFMWVVGIATSLAAMWVFFRQGLYASFGLNTYYFITSFVGLWKWRQARKSLEHLQNRDCAAEGEKAVIFLNRLSWKAVASSAVVTILGVLVLSAGMEWLNSSGLLTENPMATLDSTVTVLSAVATWWLVRSYREQWLLWILADSLSIVLCAIQGMWWMAVLYFAYVAAAVYGLRYWKKRGVYLAD